MKPEIFTEGDFLYNISADGTAAIAKYTGAAKAIAVPPVLGGRQITSIGEYAFSESLYLEKITLPDGIASIGGRAFYCCPALADITFPRVLVSIGEKAFFDCISLSYINFPGGLVSIGDYAFENCSSLMGTVYLPVSVSNIGCNPFRFCALLTGIEAASNSAYLKSVDGVLFNKARRQLISYPCGRKARSYTVPDGVTEIGGGAFDECLHLTAVTLPEGVTSIGSEAFDHCSKLKRINLPGSLSAIEYSAFGNCSSLTAKTVRGSYADGYCAGKGIPCTRLT